MPRWLNVLLQVIANVGQVLNASIHIFSHELQPVIAVFLACLSVSVSTISHSYNPDGTKAEAAYKAGGGK